MQIKAPLTHSLQENKCQEIRICFFKPPGGIEINKIRQYDEL